jgi:predicted dehydrogenase
MATTVADAERLLASAERGGARLMAAHNRRFNPNAQALRGLVRSGCLGGALTITAGLGSRYGSWPQRTEFRKQRHLSGGGVLLDLGIHLIDLVIWMVGTDVSVVDYRAADHLDWGVENDAEVVLALPNRGRAVVSCSYTHGLDRTFRVRGDHGWAHTGVDVAPRVTLSSKAARICRDGVQHLALPERDPYREQLEHFIGALVRGEEFLVDSAEVVKGLDIVEQCYRVADAA